MEKRATASGSDSNAMYSQWFVIVTVIFVTCLIIANIIAVKLINVFDRTLPAAIVIFPISYICGDVLTEVYGYSRARKVIWLGFFCNLIAVMAIWAGQILPAASFWEGQKAYENILGYTPRLLGASFLAYVIGEFSNAFILAKMKVATQGRWLWTRTIGSTLVGQGLDTIVFITLAFAGTIASKELTSLIFTQWVAKSLYEVAATPLTYKVVNFLKKQEGTDVYDVEIKFSPLLIRE